MTRSYDPWQCGRQWSGIVAGILRRFTCTLHIGHTGPHQQAA